MRINEEREGGWLCGRARCQENLSLKKDSCLEMRAVTPRGERVSPAEGLLMSWRPGGTIRDLWSDWQEPGLLQSCIRPC